MSTTITVQNLDITTTLNEVYGGTNQSSYNTGDILYASAPNTLSKLPIGTNGQYLSSNGTIPTWASIPSVAPTTETLNLTTVSQAITPSVDYTFLNNTGNALGTYQWAARASSNDIDRGFSVASDSTGVYMVGYYNNIITIYDKDDISSGTLPNDVNYNMGLIVKYDTSGNVLWTTRLISVRDVMCYSVATDSTGMYVVGEFSRDPLTIYNSNNTIFGTMPNSNNGRDIFIVKYNTSGNALWSTRIGAGGGNEIGYGVATDSTGLYVTGIYDSNPAAIYNSNGLASGITLPNSSARDTFIVKYDTSGFAQWGTRIGGSGDDIGRAIKVDTTGVYVTGSFNSLPMTLYNSGGASSGITLSSSGDFDIFIVKYSTLGIAQWGVKIGGTAADNGYSITTDDTGVYVCGDFLSNPITLFNSNNLSSGKTAALDGTVTAFLAKYDIDGFAQWVTRVSSSTSYGITSDQNGIYVTGKYIDNPSQVYNSDTSLFVNLSFSDNSYIVNYDSAGFGKWAVRMGGNANTISHGIIVSNSEIYVTGYYNSGIMNLYNSTSSIIAVDNIPNATTEDVFIVKYSDTFDIVLASLADRSSVGSKILSLLNRGVVDITVTNMTYNGLPVTKLTLTETGDTINLGWNGSEWFVINNTGVTIS